MVLVIDLNLQNVQKCKSIGTYWLGLLPRLWNQPMQVRVLKLKLNIVTVNLPLLIGIDDSSHPLPRVLSRERAWHFPSPAATPVPRVTFNSYNLNM